MSDSKHIDSVEIALEVGIERVRHLPEPFDKETSEKLNEIADCLNLLTEFVIAEARYARIKNQQIVQFQLTVPTDTHAVFMRSF